MVINGTWEGHPITFSIKSNCLTISLEKPEGAEVFSYDLAGRLWTALSRGVSYRRGLDGKMVAKWQTGEASRARRWVLQEEALEIEALARQQVAALSAAIRSQAAWLEAPLPEPAQTGIERALAFDAIRSKADAARYFQVYRPVGILPPDQYMAVVLQATEGCAFNTCTFCNFYRDRPFRIKQPDEFLAHARAVRDFLGDGLSLRRTVFLGDANALIIPMPKLLPLIDVVHQVYDVERLGGIYAFLDGFSASKKSPEDYRALAERGMQRIYVGMESGNADLLKFLKKPGTPADAVNAVRAIKEGGVAVGVIVLLGAGGKVYENAHIKDTIHAINLMGLDMDDLIYFSELIVSEEMEYVHAAYQADLDPLSPGEQAAQGEAIERGLKFSDRGIPHISRYDIREFIY